MTPSFLDKLLARNPRKIVRFPEVPVEEALVALRRLQRTLEEKNLEPEPTEPAVRAVAPTPAPAPVAPPAPAPLAFSTLPASEESDALVGSLGGLVTQVWRAKVKMVDATTGEPREEMKRVYRHIQSALDLFEQMGLTMNDWVNQPYDAGLPVKVLTFQPTPGLARDTVLEAVRPTVIWKGRLLQPGEVVVGIPMGSEKQDA